MKQGIFVVLAALGIVGIAQSVQAQGFGLGANYLHLYFGKMTAQEKQSLQIDWVAYYKNGGNFTYYNGQPNGSFKRIQYAPVFVSPTMQWAVPNSVLNGQLPIPGPGSFGYGSSHQ